jgi:hypothetical protein
MRRLIARVLTTLACLGGLAIAVVALPLSVSAAQGPTLASISMNPTVHWSSMRRPSSSFAWWLATV